MTTLVQSSHINDFMQLATNKKKLKRLVKNVVDKNKFDGKIYMLENIESWTGKILGETKPEDISGELISFNKNDVLFGKLRPYLAKIMHADESGLCSGEFLVLRSGAEINSRFLFYYLISRDSIEQVNSSTYGAKMPRASWDIIGNLPITVPAKDDQNKIVSFLDQKISKIDQVIAKKKHLLELLEDERKATIDSIFLDNTKKLVPFLRLINYIKDGTHGTHERVDKGIPFLSAKNVFNSGLVIGEDESLISEKEAAIITANGFPKKGDLLLTCVGTLGRSYVWDRNDSLPFQRSVSFIRLKSKYDPYYYKYYCETSYFQDQINLLAKTSAQSGIYMGDIKKIPVPVMAKSQQKDIIDKLNSLTHQNNKSKEKIHRTIELLEEYKSSLIANAVTGRMEI